MDELSIENLSDQFIHFKSFQASNGFTQFESAPSHQHFNNNPSSNVNHVGNLISGGSRPSREQTASSSSSQQQFSNFGQCGKKNAKGLTGRIASSDFREGDTDFGKYFIILLATFTN